MTDPIRQRMRNAYLQDETAAMARLIELADLDKVQRARIGTWAVDLVDAVRDRSDHGLMEEFLGEYGLSSDEGVALMCLAEALLRVPDAETIDELIQDKIAPHDWGAHLGKASSSLVNASTWALMLTGRVIDDDRGGLMGTLHGIVRRLGEPVVRVAVSRAMREMGAQFVLGRDIDEAVERGADLAEKGYTYSYDMLGEAAKTDKDAQRYHGAYAHGIASLARLSNHHEVAENPGISVKLSALHPRYEAPQRDRMLPVMTGRMLALARAARDAGMGLNIDAEEADRLDLSLDVIETVLSDPSLAGWDGFGVVVQAYGPRAAYVIDWLQALAERLNRRIMVRLVKGAYWDTEIKRAQVLGLNGFPVFTRKAHTDVSYIACARKLLEADRIYPQFATHNAHTVAAVLAMAGKRRDFEFQRLHGMGEVLHEVVRTKYDTRCRIYAPVGAHRDLLAYLVRRLLENGANSSFVNQIVDEDIPAEAIAADPFLNVEETGGEPAPEIAPGPQLYGKSRKNSRGWDITDPILVDELAEARDVYAAASWSAGNPGRMGSDMRNPARPGEIVGTAHWTAPEDVPEAIGIAEAAQPAWAKLGAQERAKILRKVATLYERHAGELTALMSREAGKTWQDGVDEIREAVDFLRYYAGEARRIGAPPRGVFACISPWNFPLAIFTGQIAAALAVGNAVVAKPAEQTPLIAARAIGLMHQAGVPKDVLLCLPGDGAIGAEITSDPRLGGVAFTGSTAVAQIINRQLAKSAPTAALIAETGGLNAMIVDSTALPEQAIRDIVASAFQSAGQRCSALRMLYIQRDVEERFLEMLYGTMDALKLEDPWALSSDMGPLIDEEAHSSIRAYCDRMEAEGRLLHKVDAPPQGWFLGPHVFRVRGIERLEQEVFGPILHVARFDAWEIDDVIEAVNASGYALTFGLHTRVDARVQHIVDHVEAGNVYVNRNQIGAIVGAQPFGGHGLSGTGPKAGGPLYLQGFVRAPGLQAEPSAAKLIPADKVGAALQDLDLKDWCLRRDRNSALRAALRGKAARAMSASAALDPGPVDLPGPTGESNRYRLEPRGAVLCLGPGEALIDQAVQALAMGNGVVAAADDASDQLAALLGNKFPIAALDGTIAPAAVEALDIAAIAWAGNGEHLKLLRHHLAAKEGPIIPVLTARIQPAAYVLERAICIDTTAAGGNTALLAHAG
ncbi:MAG: bifunctional proline dehydrogenase/L-glutamate gamma-semialdehyde dehydrogenase PutA [Pseudomonadota bacterium]